MSEFNIRGLTISLPKFTGNENRPEVENFTRKIKLVTSLMQRKEKESGIEFSKRRALLMTMHFEDKALTWLKTLEINQKTNFHFLMSSFETRFMRSETVMELAIMSEPYQKENENIDDFYDRCHYVTCAIFQYDNAPDEIKNNKHFQNGIDRSIMVRFINGVSKDIKTDLMIYSESGKDEMLKQARFLERKLGAKFAQN